MSHIELRSQACGVNRDLFEGATQNEASAAARCESLGPGAMILRSFATLEAAKLLTALARVTDRAPFRFMTTPGGYRMSVAMTNCGSVGWISEPNGYRYDAIDPMNGEPWPLMPAEFAQLATDAAASAGFSAFSPDACLINRYQPGARLSLHQDRNERDFEAPIVSVSLGLPAVFLFGGGHRAERARRVPLGHGDVVVWGGPARLRYHGVLPLEDGEHSLLGRQRLNLTFRKAT